MIFAFIVRLWLFADMFLLHTPINEWGFTEYLINFSGGFVRRGIIGEGLFAMARIGIPTSIIVLLIKAVSMVCYAAVLGFFIWQFRKHRWNWWIILAPVFMGFVMCIIRKDFMQELMLIGMLAMLGHDRYAKGRVVLWVATAVCIIELLIHEAFVFWGIPIIVMLIYTSTTARWDKIVSITVIVSTFITMCWFKGSPGIASDIIQSWQPYFPDLQEQTSSSIGAIGWDTMWTFRFHCMTNFCSPTIGWLRLPLQLAAFICYTYMVCNFVYTFSPPGHQRELMRGRLTAVYMLTATCMIPMFTVLSVDYSRLYQYLCVTSFATVLLIPGARLDRGLPGWLKRFTTCLNNTVDSYFTPSKGLMVALLFLSDINGIHQLNDAGVGTLVSLYHGLLMAVHYVLG